MDALEEIWGDSGVKFIAALEDPGSPYSCQQWQDAGIPGMPLVLDENASDATFFNILHDSWNAYPTFALIDHTMTIRAKPWTLESQSNSNNCDGSNNTIDGWSGGSTNDFIQQLVDECGVLCEDNPDPDQDGVLTGEDNCPNDYNPSQSDSDGDNIGDECDDCNNMPGDLNDDLVIDVLDVVNLVNIILVVNQNPSDCEVLDADYNNDSTVNIQDVILVITNILN